MLGNVEHLLTDDFEAFTAKIKAIHEKKKEKTCELKALYEKHKEEIAALDAEAKTLYDEWQKGLAGKGEKKADAKPAAAADTPKKGEKGAAASK
jgi:hypothetical protein